MSTRLSNKGVGQWTRLRTMLFVLSKTKVVNSRFFKRQNVVWRRRKLENGVVFTTKESFDLDSVTVIKDDDTEQDFSSAKLFISIMKSLDHLEDYEDVAWSLKNTVEEKIINKLNHDFTIASKDIANITIETLKQFNKPAYIKYASYHQNIISSRKLANVLTS